MIKPDLMWPEKVWLLAVTSNLFLCQYKKMQGIDNFYSLHCFSFISLFHGEYNLTDVFAVFQKSVCFFGFCYGKYLVNCRLYFTAYNFRVHILYKFCKNLCLYFRRSWTKSASYNTYVSYENGILDKMISPGIIN